MESSTQARKYVRFKYTEDALANALQEINNGLSINKASVAYGIPKSTLHNKLKEKVPNVRKMGPPPILNQAEEDRLENWIISKAKLGFPMHPDEVKDAVQKILKSVNRPNPFNDDRPGDKWLKLFLNRHSGIRKRNTEIISKARAAVTEEAIRNWFAELKSFLQTENLLDMIEDPSRVFNADETGMRTCMKSGLVLGPARNFKNLYEISSGSEKESITVLCTYSAAGIAAPPMVVFPYKRIPKELALSVPEGWAIGRSDSGWMTAATFFEYIANVFYPWLNEQKITFPVILFIDGHKSHYNMELYEFCVEKKIILYCLYPNSTHIMQPCDVSIFRPLKVQWKEVCRAYKQKYNATITRHNFCPLFKEAFDKAMKSTTVINGFRICGLYPLNPDAVDYSKCISTRRNELSDTLQKEESVGKEFMLQDYKTTLQLIRQFVGKDKIQEYNETLERNLDSNRNEIYSFWKFCKLKAVTKEENTPSQETDNTPSQETDNTPSQETDNVAYDFFTEQDLDKLPLEIDGILFHPNTEKVTEDNNNISALDEIEGLLLELETKQTSKSNNDCDINVEYDQSVFIQVSGTELKKDCENNTPCNKSLIECKDIMESIIERVFKTIENKTERSNVVVDKKINILSNIVISKGGEKTAISEDIWKTHLHWPTPKSEIKRKCRNNVVMPYAITSTQWAEFQKEQDRKKSEKEENIRKRKREREQKREEKEKNKMKTSQKSKEKREQKETKKVETSQTSKEKRGQKETKKVETSQTSKEENCNTQRNKLSIGEYVIVEYEKRKYPGIIKDIDDENDEYEISVMTQTAKKNWKWPKPADQIWYRRKQIIKKIDKPKALNPRGLYQVRFS